jgi:hypothetical protein
MGPGTVDRTPEKKPGRSSAEKNDAGICGKLGEALDGSVIVKREV